MAKWTARVTAYLEFYADCREDMAEFVLECWANANLYTDNKNCVRTVAHDIDGPYEAD